MLRTKKVTDLTMIKRLLKHCQENDFTIVTGDPTALPVVNKILKCKLVAEPRDEFVIHGEFNDRDYIKTKGSLIDMAHDFTLLNSDEFLELEHMQTQRETSARYSSVRLLHERR